MARYYVVREHARPFLSSVPTFVDGDGTAVEDRVEGDRWVAEMDRAQRFARDTVDGVIGAEEWATLLGAVAARDQRDAPETIAAPTRDDRARAARRARGDGARKERLAAIAAALLADVDREVREPEPKAHLDEETAATLASIQAEVAEADAAAHAKTRRGRSEAEQARLDAVAEAVDAARPAPSFLGGG